MSNSFWTEYPEIIKYACDRRAAGDTYTEIAKGIKREFDISVTYNQAKYLVFTYGPDTEINDMTSGRALVKVRSSQNNARAANADNRKLADLVLTQDDMLLKMQQLIKELNKEKFKPLKPKKLHKKNKSKMTVEMLFSDWQIGKTMKNYDSNTAIARLREYTRAAIGKINQHLELGYDVEKIVLVLLGDIIESAEKATKKGSPRSVDSSTPVQLQLAIKHLFVDLIVPLSQIGINIEVIGVPGNHDGVDNGMINYNPGSEHLSWTIYKTLELLSEQAQMAHVRFKVPVGYFSTVDYYGQTALYEHGYGLSATEAALNNRRNERMRQLKKYLHYFRMGDKHNICRFNDDTLVVNGAFFGSDTEGTEYASINGYASIASQVMFFHVPRKDKRLTIYDSFSIQLNHIE